MPYNKTQAALVVDMTQVLTNKFRQLLKSVFVVATPVGGAVFGSRVFSCDHIGDLGKYQKHMESRSWGFLYSLSMRVANVIHPDGESIVFNYDSVQLSIPSLSKPGWTFKCGFNGSEPPGAGAFGRGRGSLRVAGAQPVAGIALRPTGCRWKPWDGERLWLCG